MDEQIPKSTKLQWINTTLKFLKNDNQLIMEYPEMPMQHMKYLRNLIWQHNNVELRNNLMYSSLWEALKVFRLKYSFKVFVNTSGNGNTGRLAIEKILKDDQENYKPVNENLNNSKHEDKKKKEPKTTDSPSHRQSKTQKLTPKQDKFFIDCRKIIDSISPVLLRKGLQKMLDFLHSKMDASVTFSDLAPIEARFYENFLGIYNRRCEFQGLFPPSCNDLLEKMSKFFKEFDKEFKLEVYPSKHNMDFRKREVKFLKVPRYTRNTYKKTMAPALETCYTEKAYIANSAPSSAVNNVDTCISTVSTNSNIINKKLSASNVIHNVPYISTSKNSILMTSSATKNISSAFDGLSEPNAIKTTIDSVQTPFSGIDNMLSSSAINNIPSTITGNKMVHRITNDMLSTSSACKKAIPSAINNISAVSNSTNKVHLTSMSGSNTKNDVPNIPSAINNVPSCSHITMEDSASNTIYNKPMSSVMNITQSSIGKNIVPESSVKKEASTAVSAIDNMSFSFDIGIVQSASNVINKPKGKSSRKEKLLEAMSTPLESEKGLRIMRSMGWEGGALGLRGEGLIEPIIPALHIVPGVGLGHEVPIKTKTKTTKSETKVESPNKATKVNNRLKFLTSILDLLQRDKSIPSVTYSVWLAKKEVSAFENIMNAINMRSYNCLTEVENLVLEKIDKIMAQNTQLSLRLDFSHDMRELTIVKSYNNQVETRSQKKNKKKKRKIDKTDTYETSMSDMFSKDELAMHICGDILKFMRCEDTKMVIANDANKLDRYVELIETVCECVNKRELIPYTPVKHLADDILKISRNKCVELELSINKKSFVLQKTCYQNTGSPKKRTKLKHSGDMETDNSINTLEQKRYVKLEADLTNASNNTFEQSNKELGTTTLVTSSSKINSSDENKSPTDNLDIICKQIDSIMGHLIKHQNPNNTQGIITHKNVNHIEIDEIKTDELDVITDDPEVTMISDDDTDDVSNEKLLDSGKNVKNMLSSDLAENKGEIIFTENIYEQIDSLLEKLKNYEKTWNTRAKPLHKCFDNTNNNKSVETICTPNDTDLSFNETDIYSKENNKQGSEMDVDSTDVDEASLNKVFFFKKQVDIRDKNSNDICERVDPIRNNLGKYISKTENSKPEILKRNENDISNNLETVTYIFLVNTLHSHINDDEKSSRYSIEDISAVTPVLTQSNNLIRDLEKFEKNSHNSHMSENKDTSELNNLKPVSRYIGYYGGQLNNNKLANFICTEENKKIQKQTKKRSVICVETDNFTNINENLVEKAIEVLTSQNKIIDNIDGIKMHNEIIKTNYYKEKNSEKVNGHLKFAKLSNLGEKFALPSGMITYTSRAWYEHSENFLKCDDCVENINAYNTDNTKDLVTHIEENETLIEKGLKPINIDLNKYPAEEKVESNLKYNDMIANVAINKPSHSGIIEEIILKCENVKIDPKHSPPIIDNIYMEAENVLDKASVEDTLVLEPELRRKLTNGTEAIEVSRKVEEGSIEMDTKKSPDIIELIRSKDILNVCKRKKLKLNIVDANKDNEDKKHISGNVTKISNTFRNINSTEIIICHDIVIIESDECTTDELKSTVQKLIQNNVGLEKNTLPLLKYHGALDDGIVYSCHGKETCLWLKRVLSDFRVKDYRNAIDTHKMKIIVVNFNENVNLLELLELYYMDIKSRDWKVIYEKCLNGLLIFGVEMNTDSFKIVSNNNFSLFVGFDVAQFSIGY